MRLELILNDALKYRTMAQIKCNAHYKMCRVYYRRHNMVGIPAVMAGTIVGTTIFGGLANDGQTFWIQIAAGALAIAAVVLSSLQTFFNFPALSAHHKEAAVKYEAIRHDLDHLVRTLVITPPGDEEVKTVLTSLQVIAGKMNEVAQGAPTIRTGVYNEAKRELQEDPPVDEVTREHLLAAVESRAVAASSKVSAESVDSARFAAS